MTKALSSAVMLALFLCACGSEEAEPYREENRSMGNGHEQGVIRTH